jgi:hypothetical protein
MRRAFGSMVGREHRRVLLTFAVLSAATVATVAVVFAGTTGAARHPRGGGRMVLLQHAVTQKLAQDGKCDAACQEKAAAVQAQMSALRKEIQSDYQQMTHFGDQAGYVPPPRSIKAQVMDGSLLGGDSSDGPTAPPPFSPNLAAIKVKPAPGKAFGEVNMKKLLKSQEPHVKRHTPSGSSILPPVQSVGDVEKRMLRDTKASPSPSDSSDSLSFLHPDTDAAVHVHLSSHRNKHSAGKAKWAKEFSFVGHHAAHRGRAGHKGNEAKWAKEFNFVKQHAAKVAARSRIIHRAFRTRKDAEPAVVRHAMQKALSFAPHMSKTEQAGDKLLGLTRHRDHDRSRNAHKDPLGGKFLAGESEPRRL